jgi:hypothetical protein
LGFTGAAGATGPAGPTGPAGANGAGVFGAAIINPLTPATFYVHVNGTATQAANNPEFGGMAMPVACTFDRVVVNTFGVSGGTTTFTVNFVKNGVDQALSCSVTNVVGGQVQCSDTSHTVPVVLGDIVAWKIVQVSGTPIVRIGIGTRCN